LAQNTFTLSFRHPDEQPITTTHDHTRLIFEQSSPGPEKRIDPNKQDVGTLER